MKKHRIFDHFFVLVFIAFILGSIIYYRYSYAKENHSKETIKIAWLPITHSLPVLETKERLESDGNLQVELVKYASWPELMDALNSGRVDGASVLAELAMKSKEQGVDLQLAALGHQDGNIIVVSPDIQSIEDLKGKAFAIPNKQSSHNILIRQYLEDSSIDPDEITFIELSPAEMPFALESGQIDGYCVAEPFGAQAVADGTGKILAKSGDLWENSICCALVWNGSWANKHKSEADQFLEAYLQAGESMDQDLELALAEKYLSQKQEALELSLQWISFKNLNITRDAYELLAEKVKHFGLSQNPPDYDAFIYQKIPQNSSP